MSDGDGCGGEGALGDGFSQDGERGGEDCVLMVKGVEQRRCGMWGGHREVHDMA